MLELNQSLASRRFGKRDHLNARHVQKRCHPRLEEPRAVLAVEVAKIHRKDDVLWHHDGIATGTLEALAAELEVTASK